MYNPAFEKTRRKIVERRMLTLREVGEATAAARNSKAFWSSVINGFNFNEWDTPFLLLYSITDDTDDESPSTHSGATFNGGTCHLEGSLGVPAGHPAAPEMVDLRASGEGYTPYFRQALASFSPILLNTSDGSLPEFLVASLDARGFKEPTRSVVICPIVPTTGEAVYGFLILGINPRRPYDDEYVLFVQLLSRQLATSLASVVLFEEEIKRGQKAARRAAMDHYALSKELAVRTQEAQESEKKLSRMAALAPVGLFTADERGMLTFCNEALCAIIGKTRSEMQDWISFVREEDSRVAKEYWHTVIVERKPASAEFRFQQSWQGKNGESGELWVLATGYPEDIDTGSPTGSVGTITDISQQKWAEGLQKQRMEEAQEQKRQQENFIDTTSHEMRNPLSAIFQCADQISLAMAEYCVEEGGDVTMPVATAESVADAAQTISLCAQHQKRIVDDVLTVSKLDSALLIITPVAIQPVKIVQRAMKMFRNELDSNDIRLTFDIDDSYDQLNVDWVKLDPSRLLQILINLMTNAIKFTSPELTRTITVTIGASNIRPSETRSGSVHYVPCRTPRQGSTMQGDWGDGEEIFMNFAVMDTGRGLSPDEIKLLFLRFSQTTPKTHVQYGGSGLGLFISRELTELQGGEIGVASESGKGSTFAFYIVGRRSEPPENEIYDPTGGMLMKSSSGLGGRPSAQSTARSSDEQVVMVSTNASSPAKTKARRRPAGSSSETQKPVAGTESSANLQSPPIRVLVVEDNLVNQRVLQRQLQTQGCFATVAGHGVECIEMLKNTVHWKGKEKTGTELDLILMDLEMPVMDGMTCAEEIRKLEREGVLGGHVPIICVTANARDQQIQAALDAGMVCHLPLLFPSLMMASHYGDMA